MRKLGKAARAKGRSDVERAEKARQQTLSRFLSGAGITLPSSNQQLWVNLVAALGDGYADDLEQAINERSVNNAAGRPNDARVYDLMYRDLDAAMATVSFVAPMLRTWASHIQTLALPDGPLLDLGSGNGVLSCFYATLRPDSEVTAVEIHPGGVACGEALAAKLGLSNIRFVQGDVLSFDPPGRYAVVTSVASLIEMEGDGPDSSHPFSSLRSAETLWQSTESALGRTAERCLDVGGVFVSLERLPNFQQFARWIGAVQRAGLSVNLDTSTHLGWNSPPMGEEAMPAVVAVKREPATPAQFEELISWYRQRKTRRSDDFLVELELIERPVLQFVAGMHADVRDHHGEGQTRIYLLERGTDAVLYMSTSRGMRSIVRKARDGSSLLPQYREIQVQFGTAPDVVGTRDLSAADLSDELGRDIRSEPSVNRDPG